MDHIFARIKFITLSQVTKYHSKTHASRFSTADGLRVRDGGATFTIHHLTRSGSTASSSRYSQTGLLVQHVKPTVNYLILGFVTVSNVRRNKETPMGRLQP